MRPFYDYSEYSSFRIMYGMIVACRYLYEHGYGNRKLKLNYDYDTILDVVQRIFPCVTYKEHDESDYAMSCTITIRDGALACLFWDRYKVDRVCKQFNSAIESVNDPAEWWDWTLTITEFGAVLELTSEDCSWFGWRIAKGLVAVKKYAREMAPWI